MSTAHMLRLAFTLSWLVPTAMAAQVPAELREAMRARDEAVAKADAATWDRLTTDDFTVVLPDGTLLTKAERLAQFKTQKATPPAPPQQEQIKHFGDVFVRRALRQISTGDTWVLDIWVKDAKGWRVAAVQVTSVKK
jgi:GGDEF domain-containing protein